MIYFIACPELDAVKIGHTTQRQYPTPESAAFARLDSIQTSCPLAVELLAICEGGLEEEGALHRRFAGQRMKGEWFRLSNELREHIAQFPVPERRPRCARERTTEINSAVSSLFPPMGGRESHDPTARGRPIIAWSC